MIPSSSHFSSVQAIAFRLMPHEDVKKYLDDWVKQIQVSAACIISCVGSLEKVCIRFAGKKEVNIITGKFEIISLSGTLSTHGSHLHIAIADEFGEITGGHLKEGSLVNTTVEMVIGILAEYEFKREQDETYGYKELKIDPVK